MIRGICLTVLCLLAVSVFGQKIVVSEVNKKMSQGNNPALFVFIPRVSEKDSEKEWKRQIKDWDGKSSNSKGEVYADDISISSISANTVDIYAEFKDKDGGCEVMVWFDLGGAYLSKSAHADQWQSARDIIRDFAFNLAKGALETLIKEEEGKLGTMESDLDRLKKSKESLEAEIVKLTQQIEKAKEGIATNVKDQEQKTKEIEAQKQVVDEAHKNQSKLEK